MPNGYIDQNTDIGQLIRKTETDFISGSTTMSKYVQFSLWEDISRIYAYLDSKFTEGDNDNRPFFNIVLAARNIWYRATDIDRSNIKIRSTKSTDDIGAFLATIHLQDWMRRENFGQFLNNWGINSAGFNESVLKFVEQDGKLIPSVVPWSRIICDQIDFASNPKIEILELTIAQLKKRKGYNKEIVDDLCDALVARQLTDKQTQDIKNNYVKLYEVHGELPLSFLTGKYEDEEYTQQMHVITFLASKEKGKWDDYTLYSGKESKDPYMLTALLPEVDGSIALRGSVKTLFDAQWMQNHSVYAIKSQLDLASKLIFQTSDATFIGQNALSAIQNGDILIHKVNEPITQVQNTSHDTTSITNFQQMWKSLGNEITGISESMLGQTAPSGTAWRQVDALLQENRSLFELMTENRGLAIEQMLREFIIPFIKKQMNNSKEVSATLADHEISQIDAKYIKGYATQKTNAQVKEKILNGESVNTEQQSQMFNENAQQAQTALQAQGTQRYFKPSDIPTATWKETFKDLEWDVAVDITNEDLDKDAMTTLGTLLKFFQSKGGQPMTPEERFVISKMLEFTGTVSPIELASLPQSQPSAPANKVSESMSYKDVPEDVKRQIEAQAGLQPSSLQPVPVVPGQKPINPM